MISVKEKLKILWSVKDRWGNLCLDKKSWRISGICEVLYVTQGGMQKNNTHFQVAQEQWRELSQGPLVCVVKKGSKLLESSHREDTGLSLIWKLGKCTWTVCRWSIIGNFLICFAIATPAALSLGQTAMTTCCSKDVQKGTNENQMKITKIHSTNES